MNLDLHVAPSNKLRKYKILLRTPCALQSWDKALNVLAILLMRAQCQITKLENNILINTGSEERAYMYNKTIELASIAPMKLPSNDSQ